MYFACLEHKILNSNFVVKTIVSIDYQPIKVASIRIVYIYIQPGYNSAT